MYIGEYEPTKYSLLFTASGFLRLCGNAGTAVSFKSQMTSLSVCFVELVTVVPSGNLNEIFKSLLNPI